MLEIIGLVISVTAIAGFARGRGASPLLFGSLAVGGFFLIRMLGMAAGFTGDGALLMTVLSWAWIGAVAFTARFLVGAGRPQPSGLWICSNCHTTNGEHAVICEACRQPWSPPGESSG